MQRFSTSGDRLDVTCDLSPEERNWIQAIKELAERVLNYEADPVEALSLIGKDVRLITGIGRSDLDRAIQHGYSTSVGKIHLKPASMSLVGDELTFWWGIRNGADMVLEGEVDFLKFHTALGHDVCYINRHDNLYWRAIATGFLPIVQQWGKKQRWPDLP